MKGSRYPTTAFFAVPDGAYPLCECGKPVNRVRLVGPLTVEAAECEAGHPATRAVTQQLVALAGEQSGITVR